MGRWILVLLLAQGVGRPGSAGAASLSVAPAAPCLDAAELTARVERELGMPLGASVPLRFEVSSTKRAGGYDATLDVFDDHGSVRRRVVEAADCATLQEIVAVAMTLASSDAAGPLEPAAVANEPDKPTSSSAAQQISVEGASPREQAAETSRDMDAWVPSLSAELLVDAGTLPSATLGATVGAALGVGRIEIKALGTLLFEREVEVPGGLSTNAAATLGFVGAGLLACTPLFREATGWLSSRACLGWELGQLTGEGKGVARPERGRTFWSAPRADIAGRLALAGTPWGVRMALAAEVPLERDDFTLGPDTVVHRPAPIVVRAALGVDVAFE